MRTRNFLRFALPLSAALLAVVGLASSCGEDAALSPVAPAENAGLLPDSEALARDLVAGWGYVAPTQAGLPVAGFITDFRREPVGGDVFHYSARVQTGPGAYDAIGIHRVVRESAPFQPEVGPDNIFLLHGDIKDFKGMFLPGLTSPRMPDDFGFAAHLAEAGVDVWGMDQAWALVPASETASDFMADWGLARSIHDLGIGLDLARAARIATGLGSTKMHLLGYSSGAATGFAYLADETRMPPPQRRVGGFIAGDYGLLTDDAAWQAATCAELALFQDQMALGDYAFDNPFVLFGPPALYAPDEPSALIPGLTNLQAALVLAAYPAYPDITYHFLAGTFDSGGLIDGLRYTNIDMWIDFMISAPPWEAHAFMVDYEMATCDPAACPWDDRLGKVKVPILYLSAGGGAGYLGEYTLERVASRDIERLDVSFYPPGDVLLDFAHVDLFIADNAPDVAWAPMLTWIRNHPLR